MEDPRTFVIGGGILALLNLVSSGLLLGPALVGISAAVLRRQRGESASLDDLFSGFDNFAHTFLAGILYGMGVAAGLLFLLAPGLLFGALFFPVFPILAERRLTFVEAFAEARRLTLPILVEQAVVFALALALAGAGLLLFVIGTALTLPLAVVALVLAYGEAAHPDGRPAPVGLSS